MSRRDWLHKLAIGGWLIGAAVLVPSALSQSPEDTRIPESKPAKNGAAAGPSQNAQGKPESLPTKAAPAKQPSKTIGAEAAEADPHYFEREDLKAQREMANATDKIVYLTRVQIWLGIGGAIGLIWTLVEARIATNLASKTAQRQLRAYIFVDFRHYF